MKYLNYRKQCIGRIQGSPDMEPIVVFENVYAGYSVLRRFRSIKPSYMGVLRNISFKLHRGERLAIIGESGAGKTTIIKVLLRLLKPRRGRVLVFGKDIYRVSGDELRRIYWRIGYVPQDPGRSLNPRLRVEDILYEPLEAQGIGWDTFLEKARNVLREVGLGTYILEKIPDQLSGGQQQRVLIARAIIHDPELLILDEPTSALDVSMQAQIINLINKIYRDKKLTLLIITHDLAVAQYLADRAIVLRRGEIVEEGGIDDIITNPKHEYTKLLISSYI